MIKTALVAAAVLALAAGPAAWADTVVVTPNPLPTTALPPGAAQEDGGAPQTATSTATQVLAAISSKQHFLKELDCNNFSNTDTGVSLNNTATRHFFCQHLLATTWYFDPPLPWATNTAVNFTIDAGASLASPIVVNTNGYNK